MTDTPESTSTRHGLVIVYTGNGKGKTTAALGMAVRAWGRDMKVCVIQFVKAEKMRLGEHRAFERIGIEIILTGDGFTWRSKDPEASAAHARHGWELAQQKIASGQYDMIVLDEMTYCFQFGWLDFAEVRAWLEANKPPTLHLVITGRGASPELIEYADLVSEINLIKHPFDKGIKAQAGVEF